MLCSFAEQFPTFTEDFLERGRTLRRRFREETVTDLMMGCLITAGLGRIIVEFPDEPATGADMEWNFVDQGRGTFFRIVLQAKQAYGDGGSWTRHNYRELLHRSGTGGKLQAETLCDTARVPGSATYPLYVLYHPAQTCRLARQDGETMLAGVNLADGFIIEQLVKSAATQKLRTNNKSLRVIAPHLFSLSDLFCPSVLLPAPPFAPGISGELWRGAMERIRDGRLGVPIPPTPQDVRKRLAGALTALPKNAVGMPDHPRQPVPDVAVEIPADVQNVIHRARDGKKSEPRVSLDRWRVTYLSGSPRDDEGYLRRDPDSQY